MKKILVVTAVLALMGCAEKKPLTPEEQWQGYCRSVGNAARTIMLDRQNAIEKERAIEHANKIEDDITRNFILEILSKSMHCHLKKLMVMLMRHVKKSVRNLLKNVSRHRMIKCLITSRSKRTVFL